MADATGFMGGHFTVSGQGVDVALVDLEPSAYFLVCDIPTEASAPHYHVGMVARIAIE